MQVSRKPLVTPRHSGEYYFPPPITIAAIINLPEILWKVKLLRTILQLDVVRGYECHFHFEQIYK